MEPIRIGLIGCGHWGAKLARNLAALDGLRLAAVCDVDAGRAAALAERHGVGAVHADHVALLAAGGLDAAVVATPVRTHDRIARDALESGLHVLVEKPVASSSAGARDLAARAFERGRVLMADHTELHTGVVREACARLESDELGDLVSLTLVHANLGAGPDDLDVLWDLAPHDLAILDLLTGVSPSAVAARAGRDGPGRSAVLRLDYPCGAVADVTLERGAAARRRELIIEGTLATAAARDLAADATLHISRRRLHNGGGPTEQLVPCDPTEPLRTLCLDFASAIRGGAAFDSAKRAVRVVDVIERAARALASRGCPPAGWRGAQGRRAGPRAG